jgi:TRL-like protein family
MNTRVMATLAALVLVTPGCIYYQAPVMPPPGLMFSSVSAPLDIDAEKTPVCPKMGESNSSAFLFNMFAFGDCSIDSAARNGGLQTIEHADYHHLNIMFMYQRFTVRAYGN